MSLTGFTFTLAPLLPPPPLLSPYLPLSNIGIACLWLSPTLNFILLLPPPSAPPPVLDSRRPSPERIRAKFGQSAQRNAVYVSATADNALRVCVVAPRRCASDAVPRAGSGVLLLANPAQHRRLHRLHPLLHPSACDRGRSALSGAAVSLQPAFAFSSSTHHLRAGHGGAILNAVLEEGFEVSAIELARLDRACAAEFLEVYQTVVPEYTVRVTRDFSLLLVSPPRCQTLPSQPPILPRHTLRPSPSSQTSLRMSWDPAGSNRPVRPGAVVAEHGGRTLQWTVPRLRGARGERGPRLPRDLRPCRPGGRQAHPTKEHTRALGRKQGQSGIMYPSCSLHAHRCATLCIARTCRKTVF